MKDKLIELLGAFPVWHTTLKERWFPSAVERLADHILSDGWIRLPCKVGDIVYLFYPVRKGIYEAVVDEICLTEKSNFIVTRDLYFNRRQSIFFEQIGKTVFFTREEAEKALAERSEENDR